MSTMVTKRIILLIVGVVVAIAICLSTTLFGMNIGDSKTVVLPNSILEPHSNFIFIIDRDVDRETVVTKF
jgi:hypothetical protein